MRARLVKTDKSSPDTEVLKTAGEIIKAGGLVAFPTETVYGLGADAFDTSAAKKIYEAKGRPSDNPLIIHISELDSLDKVAVNVPDSAIKLASKYWPGPLTMIFQKNNAVPDEVTGGLDTVAVRFPSHPVARAFIAFAGGFVAAPSANTSGKPSPTNAEHVIKDLGDRIDMIIDAGSCDIGLESTIVDFTSEVPTVLRPGYVTEEMLADVIGSVSTDAALISDSSDIRPKAPGMKYRHYAPAGELVIFEGGADAVAANINSVLREKQGSGMKTAVLCSDETKALYDCELVLPLGSAVDEAEIARHLFAALRRLDDEGAGFICSEAFDAGPLGMAIMNRLLKAAGHRVIVCK